MSTSKGIVKWYNETKGFGFIKTTEGDDIIVHRTDLMNSFETLVANQEVEYEIKKGDKGLIAVKVRPV